MAKRTKKTVALSKILAIPERKKLMADKKVNYLEVKHTGKEDCKCTCCIFNRWQIEQWEERIVPGKKIVYFFEERI